jgi:hypothetical protein
VVLAAWDGLMNQRIVTGGGWSRTAHPIHRRPTGGAPS